MKTGNLLIPLAVIISGMIIAGTVYFRAIGNSDTSAPQTKATIVKSEGLENMNPITDTDHILGDPNALVKIVEYSDFECPACKLFQKIMTRVMEDYGKSGKVAWVYRQFPIDLLHPLNARKEAVASECAAELGGNDSFWKFANRFFELSLSNDETDIESVIPQVVREIGLNETEFATCLASGNYDTHIQEDIDKANATGGRGTPWSIVVAPNGKKYPFSGVWPEATIKQLIDRALKDNK